MNSPPQVLDGSCLKIQRADQHIENLNRLVNSFCEANHNAFTIKDLETGEKGYAVAFRQTISPEIPLLIGDAVHNLRSALDHLAWQLVIRNGKVPDRTQFPLYSDRKKFNGRPKSVTEGMSTTDIQQIESMQPYQAGYEALGILSELNNFDKHRLLVGAASHVGNAFFGIQDVQKLLASKEMLASKGPIAFNFSVMLKQTVPLKDGDVLCKISPEQFSSPFNIFEFKPKVTIFDPPVSGQDQIAVVTLLTILSTAVKCVIKDFAQIW
jgi:hypothetical protein